MKKIIAATLLFALALPVFAQDEPQEPKWTVRASGAYIPSMPTLVSIFGAIAIGVAVSANEENNETLDIQLPPVFAIDALYSFNPTWSAGVSATYAGCIWNIVDKDTREIHSSTNNAFISLCAVGRCNYLNRPTVKLYGSIEAGGMLVAGSSSASIAPCFQVNPIGVEFGRDTIFGLVEIGGGMNYLGGRVGLGCRF